MKNVLEQIFKYEGHEVRTVERDGKMWWILTDVCEILGLDQISRVADRLENDESTLLKVTSGGQTREMLAVNEPGLYNVILRSNKPEAKDFKRWVTHTVLPSVMGVGKYVSPKRKNFNGKVKYFAKQLRDFACLYEETDIETAKEKLDKYYNELVHDVN